MSGKQTGKRVIVQDDNSIASYRANTNQFEEFLAKIMIPADLKKIKNSLHANFVVSWEYGSNKPTVYFEECDEFGHFTRKTDFDTVKSLTGYKRFTAEAVKANDQVDGSLEKVKLIDNLAKASKQKIEDVVMVKQNRGFVSELYRSHQRLERNIEELDGIQGNENFKVYMNINIHLLKVILNHVMEKCLGSQIITEEVLLDTIYGCRVPYWFYKRLCLQNVNASNMEDIFEFLYPRKFTNGIGFTMYELSDEDFVKANGILIDYNHPLLKTIGSVYKALPAVTGRDAEITLRKVEKTFVYYLPSKVENFEKFQGTVKGTVPFEGVRIEGRDSLNVVKSNMNFMANFIYAVGCYDHYQLNDHRIEDYSNIFLGHGVPTGVASTRSSVMEFIEDEIDESRLIWDTEETKISLLVNMIKAQTQCFANLTLSRLIDGMKDLLVAHKKWVPAKSAKSAGSYADIYGGTALTVSMEADIQSKLNGCDERTLAKVRDGNGKVLGVESDRKKKIVRFLNIRKHGLGTSRRNNVLVTEVDEETEQILAKIKFLSNGENMYKSIKEWITTTFYDRRDMQKRAAEAVYNSLNRIDFLDEPDDEDDEE